MLYKISTLLLFASCTFLYPAYGMEEQCLHVAAAQNVRAFSMFTDTPITSWTNAIYDRPFPGTSFNCTSDKQFPETLEYALTATRDEARLGNWSPVKRKYMAWIATVKESEKAQLVKPFETWTLEDIIMLATHLTRFHESEPGSIRTVEKNWLLREVTPEENLNVMRIIESSGPQTAQEEAFCSDTIYFCPSPTDSPPLTITSLLENALFIAQRMLIRAKQPCRNMTNATVDELTRKRTAILEAAGYLHGEIVTIQPFEKGSNRLARLITHIICAQNCISPIFLDSRPDYRDALTEHIRNGISNTLRDLFLETLKDKEEYMSCFYMQAGELRAQPKFATMIVAELGKLAKECVTLAKKLDHAKIDISQLRSLVDKVRICAACKKEESPVTQEFGRCGKCRTALYCSKTCQKADWGRHKAFECEALAALKIQFNV